MIILSQAIPPFALMALWFYLTFGIPAAFAVASAGLAYTFSAARNTRSVRSVCATALFLSLVNAVGIIILISSASELVSGNAVNRLWGGIFIVTVVLSLLGWWRASRSSAFAGSHRNDDRDV